MSDPKPNPPSKGVPEDEMQEPPPKKAKLSMLASAVNWLWSKPRSSDQQDANSVKDGEERKRYFLEPIADVKERTSTWPDSVEKFATLLWSNLAERLGSNETAPADDAFFSLLDNLQHRAEKETYVKFDRSRMLSIRHEITAHNWKEAFNLTSLLLCEIRPFNIHVTNYLIEQSRTYAEEMRGQEVLVFLGRSGAGKTTTLLYLTGHDMVQRDNAYRDIGPAPGAAPEEFKVNGNPESETAYVRGIPIVQQYLRKLKVREVRASQTIVALDTPGIGDNLGAEVDVANTIGIHTALKFCKAFWPVVVLSKRDGNNFEQSQHTLKVAANLFDDAKAVRGCWSFLFSKFDNDEHEGIMAAFEHLNNQATSELPLEDSYRNILSAVEKVLDDLQGDEIVLPLDPSRVAQHLAHILEKHPIDPAYLSGQPSLLSESEDAIDQQLRIAMACIRFALEHDELDLVVQRLQEMELLVGLIPSGRIRLRLDEARELVHGFLKRRFQAATERINELKEPSTGIIAVDVLGSLDAVASAADFLQEKLLHLDLEPVTSESSSMVLADLCSALKEGATSTKSLTLHERLNQLNKLRVICERVPAVDPSVYGEATGAIAVQVQDTQRLATEMLQSDNLYDSGEVAGRALEMADHFAAHLVSTGHGNISGAEIDGTTLHADAAHTGSSGFSSDSSSSITAGEDGLQEGEEDEQGEARASQGRHLDAWRAAFIESLLSEVRGPVEAACRVLASLEPCAVETRGEAAVAQLAAAVGLLMRVQRLHRLTGVLGPDTLQGLETRAADACDEHLARMCTAIAQQCEEEKMDRALVDLRPLVLQLLAFKDVESFQVAKRFAEHEDRARKDVVGLVQRAQRFVRSVVSEKLFDDRAHHDTTVLPALLDALKGAEYVEQLQPGTKDRTLDTIVQDVGSEAYRYVAEVRKMPVQLNNLDILPKVAGAIEKLNNLGALSATLPQADRHVQLAKEHVEKGVARIHRSVESLFSDLPQDAGVEGDEQDGGNGAPQLGRDFSLRLRDIKRLQEFLDECNKCRLSHLMPCVGELEDFLNRRMEDYGKFVRRCFERVVNVLDAFVGDAREDLGRAVKRLQTAARVLQARLDEYHHITEQLPSICAQVYNQVRHPLKKLQDDAERRETKCQRLLERESLEELQLQVHAAGVLKMVDHDLRRPPGMRTYKDVYSAYKDSLRKQQGEMGRKVREALDHSDFAQVAALLHGYKQLPPHECRALKTSVLSAVDGAHDTCISIANGLNTTLSDDLPGRFEALKTSLQKLSGVRELREYHPDMMDDAKAAEWKRALDVVSVTVARVVNDECTQIDRLLAQWSFADAAHRLKPLPLCVDTVRPLLEGLEAVSARVHALQAQIHHSPDNALRMFGEMPLEDFTHSPDPLLKRLERQDEDLKSRAHGHLRAMLEEYCRKVEAEDVLKVDDMAVTRTMSRFKKLVPEHMAEEVDARDKEMEAVLAKRLQQRLDGVGELLEKRKWDELGPEVRAINKLATETGARAREHLIANMDRLHKLGVDACDSDGQSPDFLDAVVVVSKCRELGITNANVVAHNLVQLARRRLEQRHSRAAQLFAAPSLLHADGGASAVSAPSSAPASPGTAPPSDEVGEFVSAMVQCLYLSRAVEVSSTSVAPSPSGARLSRQADSGEDDMRQELGRMVHACTARLEALRQDTVAITTALDDLQAGKVAWTRFDGKAALLGHQCRALTALGNALKCSSVQEALRVGKETVTACMQARAAFTSRVADLEALVCKWSDESASLDLLDALVNVNTEEQQRAYDRIDITQALLGLARAFAGEFDDSAAGALRSDDLARRVDAQKEEALHQLQGAMETGNWERCDLLLSHLRLMQHVQRDAEAAQAVRSHVQAVQAQLQSRADAVLKRLRASKDKDAIAEHLIELQEMADGVDCVSDHITTHVAEFLQSYDRHRQLNISELGFTLETCECSSAKRVLEQHSVFKGYMIRLINSKLSCVSLSDTIQSLQEDPTSPLSSKHADTLRTKVEEFRSVYEAVIQRSSKSFALIDELAAQAQSIAAYGHMDSYTTGGEWTMAMRDNLPRLLASIFGIWTLRHASDSLRKRQELMQPHPSQVVCIFRLLGIGTAHHRPHPHLVQVLTGQGKSVVLGVLASVLALYGMHVSVACYSEYLSERDHRDFEFLFDKLGISQRVQYGTFNQLCETHISAKSDVRTIIKYLLKKGKFPTPGVLKRLLKWAASKLSAADTEICSECTDNADACDDITTEKSQPRVLLLDEVDVALDPSILGNTYAPNCQVTHAALQQLMLWLWKNRDGNLTSVHVKQTDEYKALLGAFKEEFHPLLESCTNALLQDLRTFEDHDYVFENGRIGYKLHDSVSYKMRMRYKTVFALMHELEKQGVDVEASDTVRRELCFLLNCGEFSYFEVQKTFDLVLGVTATLQELSEPELKVLRQDYGIETRTVMPSIFGASKLKPFEAQDLQVVGQEHFLLTISQEVRRRHDNDRPVLVVFETERQLQEYLNHDSLQGILTNVQVLSETLSSSQKEKIVRKATQQKRITLCTRSFGRGIDFQVRDPAVIEKGGMHVLQTFLAETMAEEKQIMGRTARQGEPGSYSVVLCKEHLEVFGVQPADVEGHESVKALRDFLWKKRDEAFARKFEQNYKIATNVKEQHDASMAFLDHLHAKRKDEVVKHLEEWNYTRQVVKKAAATRTLWALDCTCSMGTSLAKTTQVIGIVFERIEQILKDKGLLDNSDVALQLVAYRNYNTEADQLLQASPWEQNPMNLRQFLSGLSVNGGWGNEAIEVALARANTEKGVSQVILIGDAPANTPEEVELKRNGRGEQYWRKFPAFAKQTTAEVELQKLKDKGIPVQCFYIKKRAKKFFEHAASVTGGRCEKLDIESKKGAEQLTDLVSEEMLRVVGGDKLVDTYRATYCK